jgi:3-methyladenine DNA glycosylase/8-oxoguanine DNA glycosylase
VTVREQPLELIAAVNLIPTAPFDFDSTFHKPDHFTSGDNAWESGKRWQTWRWQREPLGLVFNNTGTIDQPGLRVDVYAARDLDAAFRDSLCAEIRYRYNLDLDLTPFYRTFASDPVLGPIQRRWRGMRPGHPNSLYEYLIIGIVLQNATIRRSIQMYQALLEQYGTRLSFADRDLWGLWNPGDLAPVTEDDLRALKVGYRAKAIKRIDDYFGQGLLDEFTLRRQDRETQMLALLNLYGVGPATVWYLLFDVFHHWDFFNHISPWEQKIYSKLFFDRDPEDPVPVDDLLAHFERFRAYKQLAIHYIWEDLWWRRHHEPVPWLEKLIRR